MASRAAAMTSAIGVNKILSKYTTFYKTCDVRAFTLVEILLVVVLLGVLAGLAVPNFTKSFADLQLKDTTDNLAYLMRYAQSRAILRKNPQKITFNTERTAFWLLEKSSDDPGADFERISGRMGRRFSVPREIAVECAGDDIVFSKNGKMDKARIYLKNQQDQYYTVSTQDQAGYIQVFPGRIE